MATPTLAESVTSATAALTAASEAYHAKEERVALREAAAVAAAGFVPSSADGRTSELAEAGGRGIWLGTYGNNPNSLIGAVGAAATQGFFLGVLNPWTRLRGIALQTNTSGNVNFTVFGVGSAGAPVSGTLLRKDGSPLQPGDIPALVPFDVQPDGATPTNFRMVASVASDVGGQIAQSASGKGSWSRNVAGTYQWTCPANVFAVQVTVIGGGGGGGASAPAPSSNATIYAGEGGGGGGTAQDTIAVVPGQTYTVVVGGGGVAGVPGNSTGGNGGTSSFAASMQATGGQGGRTASYSTGTPLTFGRTGGIGSGARVLNLSGGYGGVVTAGATPGPGGSAQLGGQGGVISTTAGSPGSSPGGGGAGSGGTGVIAGQAGADGAVSLVYL